MSERTKTLWLASVAAAFLLVTSQPTGAHGFEEGLLGLILKSGRSVEKGKNKAPATPLTKEQAETIVTDVLEYLRNPNLKVGEVKEESYCFIVDVLTQNGSVVDKLMIHKRTGKFSSVY